VYDGQPVIADCRFPIANSRIPDSRDAPSGRFRSIDNRKSTIDNVHPLGRNACAV